MAGRRSTLLDEDKCQVILEALQVQATHRLACDAAGVSVSWFYDVLKTGRELREALESGKLKDPDITGLDRMKLEFSDAVKKAQAEGAISILKNIRAAAVNPDKWAAGMTLLERRYPTEYGRKLGLTDGQDGPVKVELTFTEGNGNGQEEG